jgi:hypothetical protein
LAAGISPDVTGILVAVRNLAISKGVTKMADDKQMRSASDRRTASKDQGYGVDDFATRHGITHHQAQMLIDRIGNDRDKLDKAAERLSD